MQNITVKYSEVKKAIEEVKNLIENTIGVKSSKIKLNNAFYQDFGVYELDWDEFIIAYENKFNSNLEGLLYERFFAEVGDEFINFKLTFLRIVYSFTAPINKNHRKKLTYLKSKKHKKLEKLTVADIVLSSINKKFTERKNVNLILVH